MMEEGIIVGERMAWSYGIDPYYYSATYASGYVVGPQEIASVIEDASSVSSASSASTMINDVGESTKVASMSTGSDSKSVSDQRSSIMMPRMSGVVSQFNESDLQADVKRRVRDLNYLRSVSCERIASLVNNGIALGGTVSDMWLKFISPSSGAEMQLDDLGVPTPAHYETPGQVRVGDAIEWLTDIAAKSKSVADNLSLLF